MATYSGIRVRFLEPSGATGGTTFYALQKLELLDGAGAPIDISGATITTDADGGSVIGATSSLTDSDSATYLAFNLSSYASQRPWINITLASATEVKGVALTAHDTISGADVYGTARLTVHGWISTYDWADQVIFDATSRDAWSLNERREITWPEAGTPTYRYYRVRVDTAQGSTSFGALREVFFAGLTSGGDILSTYDRTLDSSGSLTSPNPINLFDQDNGTVYHWGASSGPEWVQVDFGAPKGAVTAWLYQDIALYDQAPSTGAILGSNDGSTWAELGTFSAPSGSWPSGYQEIALTIPAVDPENPCLISAAIPCAAARVVAFADFTGALDATAPMRFVADVIDVDGLKTRMPISSWQATLQVEAASYLQCVIPNVAAYVAAITNATEFAVSRVGVLLDGSEIEIVVARHPLQTYSLTQGAYNYTATISGYADGYVAIDSEDAAYVRTLTGVRTLTQTPNTMRMRTDIDWLLRPGFTAAATGYPSISVSYINLYANQDDVYMDVGSRSE